MWGSMVTRFDSVLKAIRKSTKTFEAEARLAHDVVAARHRTKVESALPFVADGRQAITTYFSAPFNRNEKFYGRREVLISLHEILTVPHRQNSCSIHGIGGLGKSQLAIEYAYSNFYRDNGYKYVFWLQSQNDGTLMESFGEIPRLLELVPATSTDTLRNVDIARHWLCNSEYRVKSPCGSMILTCI